MLSNLSLILECLAQLYILKEGLFVQDVIRI